MNKSLPEYVLLLFVSTIAMQWCKTEHKLLLYKLHSLRDVLERPTSKTYIDS